MQSEAREDGDITDIYLHDTANCPFKVFISGSALPVNVSLDICVPQIY